MKDKKMLLVELLVAVLIIYFLLNPSKANIGDIATWIGSIGTVGTLIYALKQLEINKKENQEQNKITNIARFENTLFNLLSFHNNTVNSINYHINVQGNTKTEVELNKGIGYFGHAYEFLKEEYKENSNDLNAELLYIQNIYCEKFYKYEQYQLGHYFRNLYHIIKFIDRNNIITENDKKYYVSLVRAQLSTYEIVLIFYNSMTKYGKEKFLPMIKNMICYNN
ncbi:putative phage abortive infection protein [Clostridium tyrobutyricum]|uniref:putative phage abortive infection protein n=1 Tax=Clostridium tyrobutyricum TaxID=1519 RepID=UPI00189DB059|nr:putative phage abortive infection protein [Clostridium tyrobutyricum]